MRKGLKITIVLLCIIIIVLASVFIEVLILAKQKKIFINRWFVNEEKETIGVDISSYQVDVDMEKLKEQNIKFIYIKATEGSSSKDSYFAKNWENAKNANLPAGAYHFFSYDSKGETQAKNFISTVGEDLKGRLIPVVDVEYYGDKEENPPKKEDVVRELKDFLTILEKQYGVKPMIYTRSDINSKYLKGTFDEYKKWITSFYAPIGFGYRGDWYIWQYSDRGELEGYSGGEKYIDLNVLNSKKSLNDLIVN